MTQSCETDSGLPLLDHSVRSPASPCRAALDNRPISKSSFLRPLECLSTSAYPREPTPIPKARHVDKGDEYLLTAVTPKQLDMRIIVATRAIATHFSFRPWVSMNLS